MSFLSTEKINVTMRKPCCDKEGTKKGAWSKQEDQKLLDYIKTHGQGPWRSLPKAAGLHRCGKSCRLRWINYLRPDIKRGNFGQDEEDLIIKLHALLGNRWSLIAGRLPGRTDNEVKNYWNSRICKKLIKKGIDPNNHRLIINQNPNNIVQSDDHHQLLSLVAPVSKSTGSSTKTRMLKSKGKSDNERHANSDVVISCLEDENSAASSDHHLTLELTIAFPSHHDARKDVVDQENTLQHDSAPMAVRENMEIISNTNINSSNPTLILFR